MKKLLFVEGDSSETNLMTKVLSDYRFNVKHVENGSEGLGVISSFTPDILIVDLESNEKFGLELISKAVASNPEASILVITKDLKDDLVGMCLECGADSFIHKPIDERSLVSFLDAQIESYFLAA